MLRFEKRTPGSRSGRVASCRSTRLYALFVQSYDATFVRQGRTLAEWLPQLVCDDRQLRAEAADAIGGMWMALPSYAIMSDPAALLAMEGEAPDDQRERFDAAVRAAVDEPGFPQAEFAERLMLFRIALHDGWLETVERMSGSNEKTDERETKPIETAITGDTTDHRESAIRRFGRLFCASLARDERLSNESEAMQPAALMARLVMDTLDVALLAAPDAMRAMLAYESHRSDAHRALRRCGPAARAWIPLLIDHVDRTDYRYGGPSSALASVAADDVEVVDQLLDRLRGGPSDPRHHGALHTLEAMAPHLAGRTADVLVAVEPYCDANPHLATVYASVGRDDEPAIRRVAAQAMSTESRVRPMRGFAQYTFDEADWDRSAAIDGLRYATNLPHIAVPALVHAYEHFEEYDPDEMHNGEHKRVSEALRPFGADAAPVVPLVVRYLERWRAGGTGGVYPEDALELLVAIGPSAGEALPVLEAMLADELDGEDPAKAYVNPKLTAALASVRPS